jgi:hypothetical protein
LSGVAEADSSLVASSPDRRPDLLRDVTSTLSCPENTERVQNGGQQGKPETWQGGAFQRPLETAMVRRRALGADAFQAEEP